MGTRLDKVSLEVTTTMELPSDNDAIARRSSAWGAVLSMSLCVMVLIASEFMPVSLLTPLASDLRMTEGQAGQAISVSGIFAVVTSLFISAVTARLDRRTVLLSFTLLMIVSMAAREAVTAESTPEPQSFSRRSVSVVICRSSVVDCIH